MESPKKPGHRFRRPLPIIAGGVALLFLPLANLASVRYYYDFTPTTIAEATETWTPVGFAFLALAPIVGAMILFLRKVAYYSFMVYAVGLVGLNSYILATRSDKYNLASLLQTLAVFGLLLYFLRKDTATPFLADQDRGWRYAKRVRAELAATINGVRYVTRDVSYTGMYLKADAPKVVAGQSIVVEVTDADATFTLNCTVIRVEPTGFAISYDEITGDQRQALRQFLRRQMRHEVKINVEVRGQVLVTRNLTPEGMFINWPTHGCKVGQQMKVTVKYNGGAVALNSKVVRVESDGLAVHYPDLSAAEKSFLEGIVRDDAQGMTQTKGA